MEMMNLKPNLTQLVELIMMPYVGLWLRKKKVYLISHVKKILGMAIRVVEFSSGDSFFYIEEFRSTFFVIEIFR